MYIKLKTRITRERVNKKLVLFLSMNAPIIKVPKTYPKARQNVMSMEYEYSSDSDILGIILMMMGDNSPVENDKLIPVHMNIGQNWPIRFENSIPMNL